MNEVGWTSRREQKEIVSLAGLYTFRARESLQEESPKAVVGRDPELDYT